MTRLLTYWLLLCACVIAQPELTNTEATNIDNATERQAWREALELWTDDSPTFLDGTYTGDLSVGSKLTVGNGALDDTHIVNIVSAEDVITEVMLHLEWNSPTPAAGDSNALLFSMYDSALNETEYSRFRSVIEDPTDGTEDGAITIDVLNNGVLEQAVLFSHDEIIMNDNGADRNFIVKDNTTAEVLRIQGGNGSIAMDGSTLFVDSANNRVGVGTNTPSTALDIAGITTLTNGVESTTIETDAAGDLNIEPSGDEVAYFTSPAKNVYFNLGQGNTGRSWFRIGQNGTGSSQLLLYDGTVAGVKMAGDEDSYINGGRLGIGETIPDYPLHLKGTGTSNAVAFGIHASDDTPRFEILDNGTWQTKNAAGNVKTYYDPTQYGGAGLLNLVSSRLWCSSILVPSGAMAFGTGGSNTSDISFNSNGAVAFKIEGTTGDLEIGTTNSITFADNSGSWDGANIAGSQNFTGDVTTSGTLILDTNGGSGTEGIISINDGFGSPTLIQQSAGDILTFTDSNNNGSHDVYETIYLNYSLGGGGLGLGGTDAFNSAVFVGTNYLYMGSGLTIYNPFTVAGQVEATGQAASTDNSVMTRALTDTHSWLHAARLWSPSYAASFSNSGTGSLANTQAGDYWASAYSGTSNSGYGQALIARGLNSTPGASGAGIGFGRELGVAIRAMFYHAGSTSSNVIRLVVGDGNGAPTLAGSDPISDDGLGVEFRKNGANTEWRVFGHNGTTFSASAWTVLYAGLHLAPANIAVYSNGSGNITAYHAKHGDNNYTTITTSGGPTTTGASATAWVAVQAANTPTGTDTAQLRVYDAKFFTP